jgi:hypothetical protein
VRDQLLQHALHFLKAKHDALKEDLHAPWEKYSSAALVVFPFENIFGFPILDIDSLAVLTQVPCPAARTCGALVP